MYRVLDAEFTDLTISPPAPVLTDVAALAVFTVSASFHVLTDAATHAVFASFLFLLISHMLLVFRADV